MKRNTRTAASVLAVLLLLSACEEEEELIRASGTVEAVSVMLSSRTTGELEELLIEEGSFVDEGKVLARIDHSDLDLQLEQAEAGVRLAQIQLRMLITGARKEDIQQAEAALTQAEENLKQARDDFQRMETLYQTRSVTGKQRDDAEARLTVAQAQYDAARQAVNKLQNFARPEEIEAARVRLEQAEIGTRILRKKIHDAEIRSPLSGTVSKILAEEGELVLQGGSIFDISDLRTVHLTIYIPQPDLGRIHLGQEAKVYIDSYPDRSFSGKIIFISPEAEFTPKNVQTEEDRVKLVFGVKIRIPNPQGILKPGMSADAVLVPMTGEAADVR